mmetsp:Transcript_18996/g.59685  ORF Transcript_18996/g.59685 Transcript_18996/m.59685 type:complete len:293 (-) Transcript_18996:392-1270(-)
MRHVRRAPRVRRRQEEREDPVSKKPAAIQDGFAEGGVVEREAGDDGLVLDEDAEVELLVDGPLGQVEAILRQEERLAAGRLVLVVQMPLAGIRRELGVSRIRVGHGNLVGDALERVDAARPVLLGRLLVLNHGRVVRADFPRRVQILQNLIRLVLLVQIGLFAELDEDRPPVVVVVGPALPELKTGIDLAAELELVLRLFRLFFQERLRGADQAVDIVPFRRRAQAQLQAGLAAQDVDDVLAHERFERRPRDRVAPLRRRDRVRPETRRPFRLEPLHPLRLSIFFARDGLEP